MNRFKIYMLGGALLIALSLSSLIYWQRFETVSAKVYDITFAGGETSQLVEYQYNGQNFEAEFTFAEVEEGGSINLFVKKSDPGNYQLAPSVKRKNFTIIIGIFGFLLVWKAALLNKNHNK